MEAAREGRLHLFSLPQQLLGVGRGLDLLGQEHLLDDAVLIHS